MKTPTKYLSKIGKKGGKSKSKKKHQASQNNIAKAREARWGDRGSR